jgi:hypothetical protein
MTKERAEDHSGEEAVVLMLFGMIDVCMYLEQCCHETQKNIYDLILCTTKCGFGKSIFPYATCSS